MIVQIYNFATIRGYRNCGLDNELLQSLVFIVTMSKQLYGTDNRDNKYIKINAQKIIVNISKQVHGGNIVNIFKQVHRKENADKKFRNNYYEQI